MGNQESQPITEKMTDSMENLAQKVRKLWLETSKLSNQWQEMTTALKTERIDIIRKSIWAMTIEIMFAKQDLLNSFEAEANKKELTTDQLAVSMLNNQIEKLEERLGSGNVLLFELILKIQDWLVALVKRDLLFIDFWEQSAARSELSFDDLPNPSSTFLNPEQRTTAMLKLKEILRTNSGVIGLNTELLESKQINKISIYNHKLQPTEQFCRLLFTTPYFREFKLSYTFGNNFNNIVREINCEIKNAIVDEIILEAGNFQIVCW